MNYRNVVLVCYLMLISIVILFKYRNQYPVIFADEFIYSNLSRNVPLSESLTSNYLFLITYRFTNFCGDHFLGCARILNLIFFMLSMPFIFIISKKYTSGFYPYLIVVLSAASLINSYTAYFMPESMYYFFFWFLSWYLICSNDKNLLHWILAGIIFGLTNLVKPHAIFLIPAVIVFISFPTSSELRSANIVRITSSIIIFLFSAAIIKFGVSYYISGQNGLTIFGKYYSSLTTPAEINKRSYAQLLVFTLESLKGHLFVVYLNYCLPFVIAFLSCFLQTSTHPANLISRKRLILFFVSSFLSLLVITSIFTAFISVGNEKELYFIHSRYFNFTTPFVLIVVALASDLLDYKTKNNFLFYILIIITAIVVMVYVIIHGTEPYKLSYSESPEFFGMQYFHGEFYVLGIISLVSLLIAIFDLKVASLFYLFIFIPLSILSSLSMVESVLSESRAQGPPTRFDQAGIAAKQLFTTQELDKILVIGDSMVGIYRTQFYLDRPHIDFLYNTKKYPWPKLDLSILDTAKGWIVLLEDYILPDYVQVLSRGKGYSIIRLNLDGFIDLSRDNLSNDISKIDGVYPPEIWGRWSSGDNVRITFSRPLPKKFKLRIYARSFNPGSLKQKYIAHVCNMSQEFYLGDSLQPKEEELHFECTSSENVLDIMIPFAISPKDAVANDKENLINERDRENFIKDTRKLGLAIKYFRIEPEQ